MPSGRPGGYPYPNGLTTVADVDTYLRTKLYPALISNDSRGEYFRDRNPSADLRALMVRPEWYGAEANGTHDDTTSIQAAAVYASANGIPLVFSEGTYLITPVAGSNTWTFPLSSGIKIVGAGTGKTIIKVADGSGAWFALFGNAAPTDLSGLEITGITFHGNVSGNHRTRTAAGYADTDKKSIITVGYGDGIHIHGNEFVECDGVSVISLSSSAGNIEGAWIYNNRFVDIGDTTTAYDYDSSTIYVQARHFYINNNLMMSAGIAADGTRTAIETHGSDQDVGGNIITNWQKCFNITGVDIVDNERIVVHKNELYNCKRGVQLWSYKWSGSHETGYGLNGVDVFNNIIRLGTAADWGNDIHFVGIEFPSEGDYELPYNNIKIVNNTIYTELAGATDEHWYDGRGIGFRSTATVPTEISNIIIKNNLLVNVPMAGIRFQCQLTNVEISNNTIVNCGSTQDGGYAPTSVYRQPIVIVSDDISQLNICRNVIRDTNATTPVAYGIYIYKGTTTSGENINLIDNDISASGTGFTNQVYIPSVASDSGYGIEPYLCGHIRDFVPTATANQLFALGSRVFDSNSGHWFRLNANQYYWDEEDAYLTPKFVGIELLSGAARTINIDADSTRSLNLCGSASASAGATIQLYGGSAAGYQGVAFLITGTSAADRTSYLEYGHRNTSGYSTKHRLTHNANEDLGGTTTWGASTTNTRAQYSGTAPVGSITDGYLQYSADQTAGNAAPHFRTEAGDVVKLYKQVLAADLEEAYETPELDTEAEVIAALNATNAKINDLIAALQNTGLLASS